MNCEIEVVVPATKYGQYSNVLKNGVVHWVKYLPRKLLLVIPYNVGGGIINRIKKNPLILTLLPIMYISIVFKVFRLVRKDTVIHAHWWPNAIVALIIKLLKSNNYVVTVRGTDQSLYKLPFFNFLAKLVFKNATFITAVSEELVNDINNRFSINNNVLCVQNGVELVNNINHCKFDDNYNFLFVGTLTKGKGVKDLINAFSHLTDKRKNVRLLIGGSGPELESLMHQSRKTENNDYIKFLGEIPPNRVQKLMQKCDCFVFTSYSEGTPNVIKEAMACGMPIISTNLPGVCEHIDNGENGLLFEPGDIKKIIKYMNFIIDNHAEATKIGIAAKEKIISKNLTWKNTAAQYENIYEQIILNNSLDQSFEK